MIRFVLGFFFSLLFFTFSFAQTESADAYYTCVRKHIDAFSHSNQDSLLVFAIPYYGEPDYINYLVVSNLEIYNNEGAFEGLRMRVFEGNSKDGSLESDEFFDFSKSPHRFTKKAFSQFASVPSNYDEGKNSNTKNMVAAFIEKGVVKSIYVYPDSTYPNYHRPTSKDNYRNAVLSILLQVDCSDQHVLYLVAEKKSDWKLGYPVISKDMAKTGKETWGLFRGEFSNLSIEEGRIYELSIEEEYRLGLDTIHVINSRPCLMDEKGQEQWKKQMWERYRKEKKHFGHLQIR
ncbi:MAG: hypothetical protein J6Y37_06880 [Paludibacteraceae bacterium]|nr:hypothetical protein [Paludibacteraceae bacterium]